MATLNVLLTTFPGLGLPPTLCLPLSSTLSTHDFLTIVASLVPGETSSKTYITSTNNTQILDSCNQTLADLLPSSTWHHDSTLLPLRLIAPLVGGKGGFGSQLRAAGGRMSSRKKKQNAELATGSARNLDGRRLRTITEAKNLATYLATKPDMDRKEKEERRKRWEAVVQLAEQREADMRNGKTADGRRKGLSSEWIEEKEEIGESVKNAVKVAMAAADADADAESGASGSGAGGSAQASSHSTDNSDSDNDNDDEDPMELDEEGMSKLRAEAEAGDPDAIWVLREKLKIPTSLLPTVPKPAPRRFAGFDDDDISDSEEEDQADSTQAAKGKAHADLAT